MYASPTSANRRAMPLDVSSSSSKSSVVSTAPSAPPSAASRRAATANRGRSLMTEGTSTWDGQGVGMLGAEGEWRGRR
eukprot:8041-Chlamydomonas_euryale.AAC.2